MYIFKILFFIFLLLFFFLNLFLLDMTFGSSVSGKILSLSLSGLGWHFGLPLNSIYKLSRWILNLNFFKKIKIIIFHNSKFAFLFSPLAFLKKVFCCGSKVETDQEFVDSFFKDWDWESPVEYIFGPEYWSDMDPDNPMRLYYMNAGYPTSPEDLHMISLPQVVKSRWSKFNPDVETMSEYAAKLELESKKYFDKN